MSASGRSSRLIVTLAAACVLALACWRPQESRRWAAVPSPGEPYSDVRLPPPDPAPDGAAAETSDDLRDSAAQRAGEEDAEIRGHGLSPDGSMILDLPANGNVWWAVQAGSEGKTLVAAYEGSRPGEIKKIDPKTGEPVWDRAAPKGARATARLSPLSAPDDAPSAEKPLSAGKPAGFRRLSPVASAKGIAARLEHQGAVGAPGPRVGGSLRAAREGAPAVKAAAKPGEKRGPRTDPPRRFRPVLLSGLLGKDAIRPPKGDIKLPDFEPLEARTPQRTEDGTAISGPALTPLEVEGLRPPDLKEIDENKAGKGRSHWHQDEGVRYYHDRQAWGRWDGTNWSWLQKSENRWFIEAHSEGEAKAPVLMWHASHWWWKANGVWFLLHQGEAWGYRTFSELKSEGLVNPRTGAQMVYSADGEKVAVITPGRGAALFDAESGREIRRWGEEDMPKRAKPTVPTALSFHPD